MSVSASRAVAPGPSESGQLAGLLNAGHFAEAETQAHSFLRRYPESGFVWKVLGSSLQLQGKDGLSAFQKAADLLPDDAQAQSNLGNALNQIGRLEEAAASYRRALKIDPGFVGALYNLGSTLKGLGRLDDAAASYRQALAINPDFTEAQAALNELGQAGDAEASCRRALATNPDSAEAHSNLGNVLIGLGRLEEAAASYRRALVIKPDFAEAHSNLGNALKGLGQLDEALASYRRALVIKPDFAEAHSNLGIFLHELGQLDEALASYRRALAINPDFAEAHSNLGSALKALGQRAEAVTSYRRALVINPAVADTHYNLGNVLKDLGQIDEAVASYRRALTIKPDFCEAHSNLLMTMYYAEQYERAEIFAEHLAFSEQFEQPLKCHWQPHENSREPRKRMKVGYVSPDFRDHAVAYFIEPVLARHNRNEVEVWCYYNFARHDAVTERIKGYADHWLDCASFSDDELAQRIRSDGIDVLVDLAGHTAHNRLLTFARKPAPIQVTWLGFPATTGLSAMDYRITDVHAEPPGMTEHLNTETLWRLPQSFWCYRPHENSPSVIDHPPSKDKGYITFGCFNNFAKISDTVLKLWAQILARVPTARLLLKINGIDSPSFRAETQARLQGLGIPLERLILEPYSNDYLMRYNEIDIALDTFPFNGGTTSMDTLWMGVQFLALAGNACVSRMGVTILTNASLPELIAETPDAYLDLAVRLASEPKWLREVRDQLRLKVSRSPLMDEAGFTRQLEVAFRDMWLAYCAREHLNNPRESER